MLPKKLENNGQRRLWEPLLKEFLNPMHPLYILSEKIKWERFEEEFGKCYCPENGAPGIPTRVMVGLAYLKHEENLSDEDILKEWIENPYYQYFCGYETFQFNPPIHPSQMSRWRKRIGNEKLHMLIEETIRIAKELKMVTKIDLERINVDSTVMEKNITYPTDSKTLCAAIKGCAKIAKKHNIKLRQNFKRKAKEKAWEISYLMRGKYPKTERVEEGIQTLKNWLRQMVSQIRNHESELQKKKLKIENQRLKQKSDEQSKSTSQVQELEGFLSEKDEQWLALCDRVIAQKIDTPVKQKVFSMHEPETLCISKGKVNKKWEFGQVVTFGISNRSNFILGVLLNPDGAADCKMLAPIVENVESITHTKVTEICVDQGYRGHNYKGKAKVLISRQSNAGLTRSEIRRKRRRSAAEPTIGHEKSDHRLSRNYLHGLEGDKINPILSVAGFNFRKLLNWVLGKLSPMILTMKTVLLFFSLWPFSRQNRRNFAVKCG